MMRKDFLTTKYYYKTKPDGSKRQLYHDSFFRRFFLLLCKPLTPKISLVILMVKFPHSPILHYALSSWIEKTTTKTIHCPWENKAEFYPFSLLSAIQIF